MFFPEREGDLRANSTTAALAIGLSSDLCVSVGGDSEEAVSRCRDPNCGTSETIWRSGSGQVDYRIFHSASLFFRRKSRATSFTS